MGLFTSRRVAEGYARYRPHFHPVVMERIRACTGLVGKFSHALDVGCGTGLSTVALTEIASHITGTDISAEMIAVAQAHDTGHIAYCSTPAEHLPFEDLSFDIITVCGAISWIDRTQFFPEAKRVLKDNGWLVIYDNSVTDEMHGNTAYTRWYREQYLCRYPKPPRDESPVTQSECQPYGLYLVKAEQYANEVVWSLDAYVNFLMTQSNVTVAIETAREDETSVRTWMATTLCPLLPQNQGRFVFRGYIWYMQRSGA
jgi:SAM-dependent methyltransferase